MKYKPFDLEVAKKSERAITREGLQVRLYALDGRPPYCIHGALKLLNAEWEQMDWALNGKHRDGLGDTHLDLFMHPDDEAKPWQPEWALLDPKKDVLQEGDESWSHFHDEWFKMQPALIGMPLGKTQIYRRRLSAPAPAKEEAKEEEREYWLNIYQNRVNLAGLHETKSGADQAAISGRIACVPIKLRFKPGDGLSDEEKQRLSSVTEKQTS